MGRTGKYLDGLIEAGTTGLLLFAPLPFGSVVPWAEAVIEGTVAFLLGLWMIRMVATGELTVRWSPLLWPGLVLAGVLALQLRLPGGSAIPYATWAGLRLYLAYLGLFLLLGAHLVTRARILRLISVLVGWGVVLALFGLANHVRGQALIHGFPRETLDGRLVSTLVNPNHQALYFSILMFLTLGLLLRPRRRSRASAAGGADSSGDAKRARLDRNLAGMILLVGALAVIGGALCLTVSRGGLLATLAGLAVMVALGLYGRGEKRSLAALGGLLAVAVLYAGWFGIGPVLDRFAGLSREPFADARWSVWGATLRVLGEASFLGTGLGTFQEVFPPYRPPGVAPGKIINHVHNDYLELAAETGLVGLLLLAWALIGLVVFVLRRWAVRHDPLVRGLTLGCMGALGAVAAHSAWDFGLHIPANALLAVVLGALLPAVVTLRSQRVGDGVDLKAWRWDVTPRMRLAWMAVTIAWVLLAAFLVAPPAMADGYLRRAARVAGGAARSAGVVTVGDLMTAHEDLDRAARLDPGNPAIQSARAEVAEQVALRAWTYGVGPDGRRLSGSPSARVEAGQRFFATAYDAYELSVRQSPRTAQIHDRFGWFLGTLEAVRGTVRGSSTLRTSVDPRLAPLVDSDESLLPRALSHLREGVRWDPQNPYRHRSLALFGLAYLQGNPEGRDLAADAFRQALAIEPALLEEVVGRLEAWSAPRDLLAASLPRRADVWLALAQRLEDQGRREAAAGAFQEALTLASDPTEGVEVRLAYGRSLLKGGNARGALDLARQALVMAPKDHAVFATLSEMYEAMREWDEAAGALASAITLAEGGGDPRLVNRYRARLANFYLRRGQAEAALAVRRRMVQDVPNDAYARFDLANLLEERKEWTEAFPEYRAAARLALRDAGLRLNVARAYARNGLVQEAVTIFETEVQRRPQEGDLRVELAELYARMGRPEGAIEQYRQILTNHPGDEAARRALNAVRVQPAATTGR